MKSKDGKYSFYKTSEGSFRVRFFDEGGTRRSANLKTVTERDFFIRAIRRLEPLDQWFPKECDEVVTNAKNFADLSQIFLNNRKTVREISDSCYWTYETHLKIHILPVLGKIALRDLHLKDIEKLATVLKKTKKLCSSYLAIRKELLENDEFLSASYRREILTLACSIAKFGYTRDFLSSHPFKAFVLPFAGDRPYDYWRLEEE
ncbi:MAG: hypothetical protein EOP04_24415, partial [Proteobacteria bacterium]